MIKNIFTEKIILPSSDLLLDRSISKDLRFLQNSQWWSKEKLENFQNEQLQKLIQYSYKNVPYYTNLFDKLSISPKDIQTKEDLKKLPILTKADIKKNFPNLIVSQKLKKGEFYKSASSGSTGEPMQYYLSKKAYSMNIASNLRGWYWMGYRLGDKFVKISHNSRTSNEKKIQDFLLSNRYIDFKNIDNESLQNVINEINNYNPNFIRCYPDPLLFISEILENHDIKLRPRAIATTGNTLHSSTRNKIENVFDCKIFDAYSCEGGASFFECETHSCYHSAMEYAISEFVDVVQVENGKYQGRMITTDLWNYALPFIRYDSQDILEWDDNKCECGRELLSVNRIIGRDSDILITPKGKRMIIHKFTIFFSKIEEVVQFQIVQDKLDHMIFKLVVNSKYSKSTEADILFFWNDAIGDGVIIEIEYVDQIKSTPAGKRRFLIRDSSISL
jgi:phenylacetate-CoA ligase